MKSGLYRVNYGTICAGFVIKRGILAECALILRTKIFFFFRIADWISI